MIYPSRGVVEAAMGCEIGDKLKDEIIEAIIAEDTYTNPEKGLAGGYAYEIEKATLTGKTAAARSKFVQHRDCCVECQGRKTALP
jgi:hypothetical protein